MRLVCDEARADEKGKEGWYQRSWGTWGKWKGHSLREGEMEGGGWREELTKKDDRGNEEG